jgi:Flp pilus assembly protein TadG
MWSSRARGSVSVEFAAVLPLVAITMLLVAQMGLLVSEQLAVQHAAREGAREAAVTNDDAAARDAALRAGNLDPARTTIEITPATRAVGTPVEVSVRYQPVEVPLVGRFMPGDVRLNASVSMRTERASDG